ncbi:MAG: uroporphyrinogen decarboxylase family protein [Thermacetogeniaceae bacterium]|nr:hypothetical protein [Syntrophomonadaceae bacterium]
MKNTELLFKKRVKLFKDATKFNKPERVPILGNIWSYKVCDVGYKLSEALFNWDIYEVVMRKFHEKYNFDVYADTGFRNPLAITRALGNTSYIINDENNSINLPDDFCVMSLDDYDLLIENPEKYFWTVYMPKKYPGLNKSRMVEGMKEFMKYLQYLQKIGAIMKNEYGVPGHAETVTNLPFDHLLNGLRGIKDLSLDLRRYPDKVKDALDSLRRYFDLYDPALSPEREEGSSEDFCFDFFVPMIAHPILNPKQFEKFYWPYIKEIIDYAVAKNKTVFLWALGENSRLYDMFSEIPKGYCAIYLEQDDLFEAKKKIGNNMALVGGFPTTLLSQGTKQECIDYAKKLIDELNTDGGYIFGADKMITFRRDCNPENLKAINEFVLNYTN